MAVTNNLNFTTRQLKSFAKLFRQARLTANMSQLEVARKAFEYEVSHCKVSRVERAVMAKVDAHCLERMAKVLQIPRKALVDIDPQFSSRASVIRSATTQGFWKTRPVALTH